MKSTGLFGKNSGRVGGVVYSNYRGQQIVRSYQPQVKNPNSVGQVAQRAKFKLMSQIASALAEEIRLSFKPSSTYLTPRNEWVRKTFSKVEYSSDEASLPIEDIVLTNSIGGISSVTADNSAVRVLVPSSYWTLNRVKAHIVFIGYNNGGQINVIRAIDVSPDSNQEVNDIITFTAEITGIATSFGNVRAIAFVYEPNEAAYVRYEDYEVNSEEATLMDIVSVVSLKNVEFSESINVVVPRNV